MITFNEFKKIEFRVAKIKSAEHHPNADKLFVIKADLGGEERQLVAGLRGHYTPEQLEGKTIVVVSNLEPALLRGVESQAMLLAAQDGEQIVLVTTDREVAPGSKVL